MIIIAAGFLVAGGIGQGIASADESDDQIRPAIENVLEENEFEDKLKEKFPTAEPDGLEGVEVPVEEQEPENQCADGEILNDARECVSNELPEEQTEEPAKQEIPVPISCKGPDGKSSGDEGCPPKGE